MWLNSGKAVSGDSLLRSQPRFFAIYALVCGCFITSPISAQVTREWKDSTEQGYFHVAQYWNPAGVPGPEDTVVFDDRANFDVWWNSQTATSVPRVKFLQVVESNVDFVNQEPTTQWKLIVSGSGGAGSFSDMSFSGLSSSEAFITNSGINLHSQGGAQVLDLVTLTIDGSPASGSRLQVSGAVGLQNDGTLNVVAGGVVQSTISYIAFSANSPAVVSVVGTDADGNPSSWSDLDRLLVGDAGDGTLNVAAGGLVSTGNEAYLGFGSNAIGEVAIDGTDDVGNPSTWNIANDLYVGHQGSGTLNITGGGLVSLESDSQGYIARTSGSTGTVTVDGVDANGNPSTWTTGGLTVGRDGGDGTLNITGGGLVTTALTGVVADNSSTSTGAVIVDGTGANGNPSTWNNSTGLSIVGNQGDGNLQITNGGRVLSGGGVVASLLGSTSTVTVDGTDSGGNSSSWNSSFDLTVGYRGNGTLNVISGGAVSAGRDGYIGREAGAAGAVTVDGKDSNGNLSTWMISSNLYVGGNSNSAGGAANVTARNQGQVDIGGTLKNWGTGTVTLDGGSIVTNRFDNTEGGTFNFFAGSLTIHEGVTIGSDPWGVFPSSTALNSDRYLVTPATTTISPFRTLTLDGGSLTTAELDVQGTLSFHSGTLAITGAGGLTVGAAGPLGSSLSLGSGQNLEVTNTLAVDPAATISLSGGNVSAGFIENNGRLTGNGTFTGSLSNNVGGEIEVLAGQQARYTGLFASNFGEVNNFGGQIRFDGEFINNDTGNNDRGFVAGRGQFIADGGWTNQGVMAFSAGIADVLGDVFNDFGVGRIITSGEATTTFFDDVTHNGVEIRTAAGSNTVFLGAASGSGAYTGTGTVYFEGDLRPGNSPSTVDLEGDVVFGSLLTSEFELAGKTIGDFDQLNIAGTLSLDGFLDVHLFDGFVPLIGDMFEILIAAGGISGTFGSVLLPDLGPSLAMEVLYGANAVTLAVVSALPGDYNSDGTVDAADYVVWRKDPSSYGGSQGYTEWVSNFGQTAGSGSRAAAHAAVPEPASVLLLMLGMAFGVNKRRRSAASVPTNLSA